MERLLGYRLARAAVPGFRVFDRFIGRPLELRRVEYSILVLIDSNADVTQKQLATTLNVSLPYLTVTIDKMAERGLLERERNDDDRRSFFIRLTPEGADLLGRADRIAEGMESDLLACLTMGERGMLFELLAKIAAYGSGTRPDDFAGK